MVMHEMAVYIQSAKSNPIADPLTPGTLGEAARRPLPQGRGGGLPDREHKLSLVTAPTSARPPKPGQTGRLNEAQDEGRGAQEGPQLYRTLPLLPAPAPQLRSLI